MATKATATNDKAVSEFLRRVGEIREMVDCLSAHNDEHYGVDLDDVTWGSVGDLGRIRELLGEIVNPMRDA